MFCQNESYTRELKTEVISCASTEQGWEVELREAIFYPEGGGQPSDRGFIGDVSVLDVQKRQGRIFCSVDKEVQLGLQVVRLDWKHRFDMMQQHSGQHLLTALIVENFGWMTVGFHIGQEVATIDLDTPNIEDNTIRLIEDLVQTSILESRSVRPILVSRSEFEKMDIRSRGVPDWVDGPIRLIEIDGIDINNCGGTHIKNTSELQSFAIVGRERMKKKTRISFVFGGRVLALFRSFVRKEKELNEVFQEGGHIERAKAWALERKEHKKERKMWNLYRAEHEGSRIGNVHASSIVLYVEGADLGLLKSIISVASKIDSAKEYVLFTHDVCVAKVQSSEQYVTCMNLFKQFGGRGGGRAPQFQGKWSESIDKEKVQEAFSSVFTS